MNQTGKKMTLRINNNDSLYYIIYQVQMHTKDT